MLALFAICSSAWASNMSLPNDSIEISGVVRHAFNGSELKNVTIQIQSCEHPSEKFITRTKDYAKTSYYHLYRYVLNLPRVGKYKIFYQSDGFQTDSLTIEIPKRKYGKHVKTWEVEDFYMYPQTHETNLSEATVKASRVLFVVKGDTLIYNADMFKMAEGSMLDALITQLPGAEFDENGRITINGTYVSSLLLNGKDFFQGKAPILLKNLPAYTVKKIKFYQKGSDAAYITKRDSLDRLNDPWVLDINLKKEYSKGWLANFEAGYGTKDRYIARGFAMQFTDESNLMMHASINNLNNTDKVNSRGRWSGKAAAGQGTRSEGGIDYSRERPLRGDRYQFGFVGSHVSENLQKFTNRTVYLKSPYVYERQLSSSDNSISKIEATGTLQFKRKKSFFQTVAQFSYSHVRNQSRNMQATFKDVPGDMYWGATLDSIYGPVRSKRLEDLLISKMENQNCEKKNQWNGMFQFNTSFISPFTGKSITINLNSNYQYKSGLGYNFYDYMSEDASRTLYQRTLSPSHTANFSASINYSLIKSKLVNINLKYGFKTNYTSDRYAIFSPSDDDVSIYSEGARWHAAAEMMCSNSYVTRLWVNDHSPSLQMTLRFISKTSINVILPVHFIHDKINDTRNSIFQEKKRSFFSFDPSVSLESSAFFDVIFRYSYNNRPTDLKDLLYIHDDTRPLLVQIGNPDLVRPESHRFMLNLKKKMSKMGRMIDAGIWYNIYENMISRGLSYDRLTGITTVYPYNVNGNWGMSSWLSYTQQLGKKKRWSITGSVGLDLNNSVEMVNDGFSLFPMRSSTQNLSPSVGAKMNYRKGQTSVTFRGSADLRHISSDRINFEETNARNFKVGVEVAYQLPWQIDLSSELLLFGRHGYLLKSMNSYDIIFNASLSRAFGKAKNWVVKIVGTDIFHQFSNQSSYVNAQGMTETYQNVLPSYYLFSLYYQLNFNPKK